MWTVVVGHVVFNSAYATIVIQARMATLSPTLEEAAADLGATPWRTFWRVTLPLLRPAIVVAGLLAFTFSFDNVITSAFLGGDQATLPVLVFGLMRFHVTPAVNAIAAGVMLITLVTFVLAIAVIGLRLGTALVAGSRTEEDPA
jgi:ABC-type spermidine/putrescine transport system permease subunit II